MPSKTFSVKITVPGKGSDYITIVGSSEHKIALKLSNLGILTSDFKEIPPIKHLSKGDN